MYNIVSKLVMIKSWSVNCTVRYTACQRDCKRQLCKTLPLNVEISILMPMNWNNLCTKCGDVVWVGLKNQYLLQTPTRCCEMPSAVLQPDTHSGVPMDSVTSPCYQGAKTSMHTQTYWPFHPYLMIFRIPKSYWKKIKGWWIIRGWDAHFEER